MATSKRNYSRAVTATHRHGLRSKQNNNQLIDPQDDSLILMVDFKANPDISADLLNRVIQPLKPYLSKVKNGKFHKGSVTVLISGNRPREDSLYDITVEDSTKTTRVQYHQLYNPSNKFRGGDMNNEFGQSPQNTTNANNRLLRVGNLFLRQPLNCPHIDCGAVRQEEGKERFLFLDGRINDLHRQESTSLIPLISLNWSTVRLYRLLGKGDEYMKQCANLAHSQGKRLRIWGAPNTESVWRRMMINGVDWLSIDNHERFARFASSLAL